MANTTLVLPAVDDVSAKSITTPLNKKTNFEFIGSKTSSHWEKVIKVSSMEDFQKSLEMEGVSVSASRIISISRRESSAANYESSCSQWASWCGHAKIDPFQTTTIILLISLLNFFERGLQYKTINSYRSAISAYHEHINGIPVEKNPKICAFLAWVFNKRPP